MSIPGIDFSHYQGRHGINVRAAITDGAQFLIAKVSEGTSLDPAWITNRDRMQRAHKFHDFVDGGYMFALGDVPNMAQASTFAAAFGHPNGRIVAVDAERVVDAKHALNPKANDPTPRDLREIGKHLRTLFGESVTLWLYSSQGYLDAIGNPDLSDVYDRFWLARYIITGSPPIAKMDLSRVKYRPGMAGLGRPLLQQFGPVDAGKLFRVDGDAFNGTLPELRQLVTTRVPFPDRPAYQLGYNVMRDTATGAVNRLLISDGTPAYKAGQAAARSDAVDAINEL